MADSNLKVIISARDATSAGLRSVQSGLTGLRTSALGAQAGGTAAGQGLTAAGRAAAGATPHLHATNRAMADMRGHAMAAHGGLGQLASTMKTMMMMAALTAAIALPIGLTKLAVDAVESKNLFEVSMGEMAEAGVQFSRELREAFGVNEISAQRMLGVWNMMFTNMRVGRDAAYEMATGLTKLAFDLSSFYNLTRDEAFQKLQSGIAGEIEPLRRLGVNLTETEVKAWAVRNGLAAVTDELSQGQMMLARYGLIMEATNRVQGDLGRTLESPANQMRIFQEQLEMAGVNLGTVFLPALTSTFGFLNEAIPISQMMVDDLTDAWARWSEETGGRIEWVARLVGPGGILALVIDAQFVLLGAWATAWELMSQHGVSAINLVGQAVAWLQERMIDVGRMIAGLFGSVGDLVGVLGGLPGVAGLTEFVGDRLGELGKLTGIGERLKGLSQNIAASTAGVGGGFGEFVGKMISGAGEGIDALRAKGRALALDPIERYVNSEKMVQARERAKELRQELQQYADPMEFIRRAWNDMGDAAQKSGAKGKSAADLIRDALREAAAAARAVRDEIKSAFDAAERRMRDFASLSIRGEKSVADKLFAIDQQIRKTELARLNLQMGGAGPRALRQYDKDLERLQNQRRKIELEGQIRFEPQRRRIQQIAEPAREMSFQMIVAGMRTARDEMNLLAPVLEAIEEIYERLTRATKEFTDAQLDAVRAMAEMGAAGGELPEFSAGQMPQGFPASPPKSSLAPLGATAGVQINAPLVRIDRIEVNDEGDEDRLAAKIARALQDGLAATLGQATRSPLGLARTV